MFVLVMCVLLARYADAEGSWYRTTAVNPITGTTGNAWAWRRRNSGRSEALQTSYENCRFFCNGVPRQQSPCQLVCNNDRANCRVDCSRIPGNCNRVCYDSENCRTICRGDQCQKTCATITTSDNCNIVCTDRHGCRRICPNETRNCQNVCDDLARCVVCSTPPPTRAPVVRPIGCGIVCNADGQCRSECRPSVTSNCMTACDSAGACRQVCGCRTVCERPESCRRICNGGYVTACRNVCTGGNCRLYCGPGTITTTDNNCRYECDNMERCHMYCGTVPTRIPADCLNRCDQFGRCRLVCPQINTTPAMTVRPDCRYLCTRAGTCSWRCGDLTACQRACLLPRCPYDCRIIRPTTTTVPGDRNCQVTCNSLGCIETCGLTTNQCRVVCSGSIASVTAGQCQTTCSDGMKTNRCGNGCAGIPWLTRTCQPSCDLTSGVRCSTRCSNTCRVVCRNEQIGTNNNGIRQCVDHADRGECSFYRCVTRRWACSGNGFIQLIALPFCVREDSSSSRLDSTARRYMQKTGICRMRKLVPTFVEGTATCSRVSSEANDALFGNANGANCYWMAGGFCRVIASRPNIAVLYAIYAGPGSPERRFRDLFWIMAQRCDKTVCDVFYQEYVVTYNARYGGGAVTSSRVIQGPTIDGACKQYARAGDCRFYQCYDTSRLCVNQEDVISDAGRVYCQRTGMFFNSFGTNAAAYIRGVRACEMVRVAFMVTSAARTCRERNDAARAIFLSEGSEANCFWQNGRFCGIMSEAGNSAALLRLYSDGTHTGDGYMRLFESMTTRCSNDLMYRRFD